MKIRAIITGATGMVGEGVLHECLQSAIVEHVLIINRKPSGIKHSKLKEIIHSDFFDLSSIESQLAGYNACFFCLGVSSIGMKETEYKKMTYNLTLNFARTILKHNPEIAFCYVSGAGTDGTEKGRSMWAKIKGKTENDLLYLFEKAYMFRPGFMQPTPGLKNSLKFYKYIKPLYPLLRKVFPKYISTLQELALAMINAASIGYYKSVLEVKDIVSLASKKE